MKPLLTPYLHNKRIEMVKPYLKGDILDIGCGPADLSELISENQHYTGIEIDKRLVEKLKKRYPQHNFYKKNLEKDDLNIRRKFDTITMIAVIEHLKNPDKVLKQILDLLKDKGTLVITTPTPFGDNVHKIGAMLGLTSKDAVEDHYMLYDYNNMKNLLSEYRFHIKKYHTFICGMNQIFVCKRG